MATIELMIRDDLGNLINTKPIYQLDLEMDNFDSIEKALTRFKNKMLPSVYANLLEKQQTDFIQKKNNSLRCNGTMPVTVKTLHGKFTFKLQRFIENNCDESQTTYFELTNQLREGYISCGLKEFSTYYSNRLSYEDVEELIERTTGQKQLSDQKVQNLVIDKALEVSKPIESEVNTVLENDSLSFPTLNQEFDIYDANNKEVLILVDGIQVKKQSELRLSKKTDQVNVSKDGNRTAFIPTDVVLLEKKAGNFEYITSLLDKNGEELLPLTDIVTSRVRQEYGRDKESINVIAVTDGAKAIRTRLRTAFGQFIVIVLDWYNDRKKVRELMSMIAKNRTEKTAHLEFLLSHLWSGKTEAALDYLKTHVAAKNPEQLQKLITYLEKHQAEIIDYDRRQKANKKISLDLEPEDSMVPNHFKNKEPAVKKVIGSVCYEKACDSVIGKRQKHKAMSWSQLGSRSLAILKMVELNQRWLEIWNPKMATNDLQRAANDPSQYPELDLIA